MSSGGTGQTGKPAPKTAVEIGIIDAGGNLQGISASNPIPISGTISATNPSVTTTGTAAPASATYIGVNVGGNLTGLAGTANGLKVDGSAVTQPVSAASLPLPAGAATAAKQPALGTAGAAAADVITVQGIASMTAIKVDGSAVTQPVSGTFWQATQPVSAASLPLPAGAATAAKQPALGTAGTPAADVLTVQGAASMTALKVDGSAVTQPVSGSVTVSGSTSLTGVDYNAGAAGAQTQRIVEAGRSKAWLARYDYTTGTVSTSAYTQLVASTAAATTRLRIFDSSGSAMIVATGGAGSEVDQLYIPPGGSDAPYELSVPAATRVAIKALDTQAASGQLIITALS